MVVKLKCKIVAMVAPKGGVGKTTLTMALLVSARRAGLGVLGIGMDYQHSLEKWSLLRGKQRKTAEGAVFVDVPVQGMHVNDHRRLAAIAGPDIVLVDTPPGHEEVQTSIAAVCGMADLVLVPTSTSPVDLSEVIPFYRRLQSERAFFVLNDVNRRTSQYSAARAELMKTGRLCPIDIPHREAIPLQFLRGLVATDVDEPGSEWFEALWSFVAQELRMPMVWGEASGRVGRSAVEGEA